MVAAERQCWWGRTLALTSSTTHTTLMASLLAGCQPMPGLIGLYWWEALLRICIVFSQPCICRSCSQMALSALRAHTSPTSSASPGSMKKGWNASLARQARTQIRLRKWLAWAATRDTSRTQRDRHLVCPALVGCPLFALFRMTNLSIISLLLPSWGVQQDARPGVL